MRLQVKGKNVEVTPTLREYAERKLAKLGKQLAEPTQVEVELSEQSEPVDRRQPHGRRDDLHEGADAARAGGVAGHEGLDRPARRQARAPGEALPRAPQRRAAPPYGPQRRRRLGCAVCGGGSPSTRGSREEADLAARLADPGPTPSLAAEAPGWDGEARGEPGIHGVPRARRWDAVATAESPAASRRHRPFRLAGRPHAPGRGRRARRRRLAARGRRSTHCWRRLTVPRRCAEPRRPGQSAPARIEVAEVPGLTGDEAELAVTHQGRSLQVDGKTVLGRAPALERFGAAAGSRVRRPGPEARRRPLGGRGDRALRRRYPVVDAGNRTAREGTSLRRGAAHEAARRAGRLYRDARAGLPEALRRGAAREDGRVQAAVRERRGAREPPLRGVRSRARGAGSRVGPAHLRRSDDGRDRPPRRRHRRDEDR